MRKTVIATVLLAIAMIAVIPIISEAYRSRYEVRSTSVATYSDEDGGRVLQVTNGRIIKSLRIFRNDNLVNRYKLMKIYNRIEVSEEYKTNILNILNGDEDVRDLLEKGYNVTAIIPNIKVVVQGNGEVALKATEATVILRKDSEGVAYVEVNLGLSKVTRITILSRVAIEK
ncbi:MAG: hypothetical protein RMJ00_03625 [Nitrososphaerota archaeon]|nr:hypothetical protein [Candidatus Bathyarchaeota archaeon]MCX8162587.1 hypothetical protein [Candidatus Bathyarchaeota archaeon]MDW8061768.1 hypothetical protein [Nitrososphaerota archaeon]